jgi:inosose dehydratase
MAVRLGTAPDSWGVWFPDDPRQTPWQRYLDEVVEAGYTITELGPFGYLPTDPATLRRELSARGLTLSGGTFGGPLSDPASLADLEEQVRRVGDLVGTLGGTHLVLLPGGYRGHDGEILGPRDLTGDDWKRLVETTNRLGRLIGEQSSGRLGLAFHPHADSPIEYAAQVERLLDDADPTVVGLCLDTGHYAYRDGDPVDLLCRRPDRIPYLHIKSVRADLRRRVQQEDLSFSEAVQLGICAEPPDGVIDFVAFKRQLDAVGFDGYAIVEHDLYPCAFDVPLPIARRTRAYLREIELGYAGAMLVTEKAGCGRVNPLSCNSTCPSHSTRPSRAA